MPRQLNAKYHIEQGRIVSTASGVPIPEDEPVFVLRGRDVLALGVLSMYRHLCHTDHCPTGHLIQVDQALANFRQFAIEHPERMSQPGARRAAVGGADTGTGGEL